MNAQHTTGHAIAPYEVYRTGPYIGLRCPCGWRKTLGRQATIAAIELAALQHHQAESHEITST